MGSPWDWIFATTWSGLIRGIEKVVSVQRPGTEPTIAVRRQCRTSHRSSITNSIGMKLVLIPAGEFLMGSPDSDKDAQD